MADQRRNSKRSEEIITRANERIRGTFAGVLGMEFTHPRQISKSPVISTPFSGGLRTSDRISVREAV